MFYSMHRVPIFLLVLLLTTTSWGACNVVNGKTYGDCAGVTINRQSPILLDVKSYQSVSGIIAGAQIRSGGTLYLSGISNGPITVDKSGRLVLTGIANDSITNNGGDVEIEGQAAYVVANSGQTTISGIVAAVYGSGQVTFKKGAVVGGKPVE
jgi:hypothetical protein